VIWALFFLVPVLLGLIAGAYTGKAALLSILGLVLGPTILLVWSYLAADGTRDCSDCGLYWGRYWEPYLSLAFGFMAGLMFVLGAILGTGLRKLRT
jgi:uncharacterized membrane protein